MDYLFLETFVADYGVHAIVISALICVLRLILEVSIKDKITSVTRSYIEMAFAILAEFIYTVIFCEGLESFTIKSISSALLSYSISLALYSLISRIIKGKTIKVDAKTLIIESILSEHVAEEKLSSTAKTVAKAIEEYKDKEELLLFFAETLSRPAEDEEIIALLDLILSSLDKIE